MGTYARSYGGCGDSPSPCDDDWLTNDYEPTAADHSPDVLYEIARDVCHICACIRRLDFDFGAARATADEEGKLPPTGILGFEEADLLTQILSTASP